MYSVKHIDQKLGQYHALWHGRVKDLDVTDLFRNNTAERGAHGGHQLEWSGGAVFNNKGVVSVRDSVFESNRALVQGGAIFNNQVSE